MSVATLERCQVVLRPLAIPRPTVEAICAQAQKDAGVVRCRRASLECFLTLIEKALPAMRRGDSRELTLLELEVYRSIIGLFVPQEGRACPNKTAKLIRERYLRIGEALCWTHRAETEKVCAYDGTVIKLVQ